MTNNKRILVLAPHTDDGELGAGGTIARKTQEGYEIYYAGFSTCRKSLAKGLDPATLAIECKAATTILGIPADRLTLYDFDVREFPNRRQEILEAMVVLNKKIEPGLVFTPSASDVHQDHQVVYAESLRAFKNCSLLSYELPWNQVVTRSNYFVRLEKEHIDKKLAAIAAYRSQSHQYYMQQDFIRSLARVRGVQCRAEFAESFEVVKWIQG